MKEVVIIPAHNEEKTIAEVIQKTKEYCPQVIVIDDGSADATALHAEAAGAIVLKHKVNLGKGAALKTGCDYAWQQGASRFIVMDADGQHEPKEIPAFLAALDHQELVFSHRKMPLTMPLVMKIGNAIINKTLQVLYDVQIQDSQCGYRAFTAAAYTKIRWDTSSYYVETEMLLRAGKHKIRHTSIPIETIYADKYKGTTVLDGALIVAKMIGGKLW